MRGANCRCTRPLEDEVCRWAELVPERRTVNARIESIRRLDVPMAELYMEDATMRNPIAFVTRVGSHRGLAVCLRSADTPHAGAHRQDAEGAHRVLVG